jgi:hypothetical protein
VEDAQYQAPEQWLEQAGSVQFNDILSVTSLRSALSFKDVDYLVLDVDDTSNSIYFVTANPSALKFEEDEGYELREFSSSTSTVEICTHPSLISLDEETQHSRSHIPRLVLPIGRVFHGLRGNILDQLLEGLFQGMLRKGETIKPSEMGSGTLRTPITYFEALLSDMPALSSYLEPPLHEKELLADYFESWLLHNSQLHRHTDRFWGVDFTGGAWMPKNGYAQRLFNILKGNAPVDVIPEALERKRRKLWHEIMEFPGWFSYTGFVAVIDAVSPEHPIWIVESPQRKDEEGKYDFASGTAHARLIMPSIGEWLRLYNGKWDQGIRLGRSLSGKVERYPLVVRPVEVSKAQEIFSEASAKRLVRIDSLVGGSK